MANGRVTLCPLALFWGKDHQKESSRYEVEELVSTEGELAEPQQEEGCLSLSHLSRIIL